MRKSKFTPLVGILTSKGKKENTFRGDHDYFKAIQKKLKSVGGLSFVFTTEDVHESYVKGFIFYETTEKWGKLSFPFPDLIYNKVSSRKEETSPPFISLYDSYKQKNKPFFNPSYFNKWESYQILSKSNQLVPFLPETWFDMTMHDLLSKLKSNHSLYAKPINGHKGKGIYLLSFDGDIYSIQTRTKKVTYTHDKFVQFVSELLLTNQYLFQKEIKTDQIDHCKFDLRIHCLYEDGGHEISGIGVRKATKNSIVTHVPNGGSIISFQQIKHKCSFSKLNWLAETVGAELAKSFGFIGEFSMDIGLTPEGHPFIFEVNSKPMTFDEKNIQNKRITRLVELFVELDKNTNH